MDVAGWDENVTKDISTSIFTFCISDTGSLAICLIFRMRLVDGKNPVGCIFTFLSFPNEDNHFKDC